MVSTVVYMFVLHM